MKLALESNTFEKIGVPTRGETWVSHVDASGIPKSVAQASGLSGGYNEFITHVCGPIKQFACGLQ